MKNIRYYLSIAMIAALMLSGCGGRSGQINAYAPAQAKSLGTAGMANYDMTAEYEEDVSIDETRLNEPTLSDSGRSTIQEVDPAKTQEKLVYTCSLSMQTLNYADSVKNIRSLIQKYDGFVENEQETNNDTWWYHDDREHHGTMNLYLTIRIPTEHYNEFLAGIEGDGKIMSKTSNVLNVSREYHDTEAIIRNLEKQEERLDAMMDQAKTVKDMISIEERLTEVQTELDTYNTRLASLDKDVAYSTINISIEEVRKYTEEPGLTFWERLRDTIQKSAEAFLHFLEEALFAIIYAAPGIVIVTVLGTILFRIVKKRWVKKQKNDVASKETEAAKKE